MRLIKVNLILAFLFCHAVFGNNGKHPKREFRAVWIATVGNIDWPSKPNLSVKQQKYEFISIIENHKQLGINAVVVQVRPSADAIYKSNIEPWSEWFTGQQGKRPSPLYDPLEFMIKECHKRALEFHAWFNPFRLSNSIAKKLAASHIAVEKPEWVVNYGNKKILNPGIPQAREYVQNIVRDVIKRYDIDGVHFDDYFYPYPKKDVIFDDYKAFQRYNIQRMNQDDWRRDNINTFIKEMYDIIKATKPYVKFGISPFGIWRNKTEDKLGSETVGLPSYDAIYVDSKKWLEEGWIDYIAPQLYWSMDFKAASYRKLVNWWSENTYGKHLYTGHAIYKINNNYDQAWNDPIELLRQIRLNRKIDEVHGSIFFSSSKLIKNPVNIQDSIKENIYKYPALIPIMKWKDSYPPESPQKIKTVSSDKGNIVKWNKAKKNVDGGSVSYYVLYRFDELDSIDSEDPSKILAVLPANQKYFLDENVQPEVTYNYGISALDRLQNESTLLTSFQKQSTDSDIKNITVYPLLAQINRQANVSLKAGLTQLTFTNLSRKINPESLVCVTHRKAIVKDIKYFNYFPLLGRYKAELDSLTKIMMLYNDYIEDKNTSLEILKRQHFKLLKEKSIIMNQSTSIKNLKKVREKLEEQLKEIKKQKNETLLETDSLSQFKDLINSKITSLNNLEKKESGKVIVHLYTKSPLNLNVDINYTVNEVRWQPELNFSMKDWGKPLTLDYKLNLLQNTGIDWEHTSVTFTNKPLTKTFNKKTDKKLSFKIQKRKKGYLVSETVFRNEKKAEIITPFVDITFDNPQTIFSDSSNQQLFFRNSQLKTNFEYLVNANKSNFAFSIARLANWQAYQLPQGKMNLYINNVYSGSSLLIPDITADTLDIILGNDHDILVSKKLIKFQIIRKLISIYASDRRSYQIFVANNKTKNIKLKVAQYIPLANDNRLKISVIAPNAKYNTDTGLLTWNLELAPNEKRTLYYEYLIKYTKWTKVVLE